MDASAGDDFGGGKRVCYQALLAGCSLATRRATFHEGPWESCCPDKIGGFAHAHP